MPHHQSWLPLASERPGAPDAGAGARDIRPHHRTPLPCVAYPPQCVRFATHLWKSGSHDVATVDWECGPSVPVPIFCSAADGCMRASGFPTLRPFQKTGIVAVAVLGTARVRRCCLSLLRPLGHRRSTGELCDDAVWTWTVGPKGFECRQNDGSRSPGLAITPACGMYEVLSRLGCELRAPSAGQSRCAPAMIWPSPPHDDSRRPHAVA